MKTLLPNSLESLSSAIDHRHQFLPSMTSILPSTNSISSTPPTKRTHTESESTQAKLFGPLPPHKRRKFIVVDDALRHEVPPPTNSNNNNISNNTDNTITNTTTTTTTTTATPPIAPTTRPNTRVCVQLERINPLDIPDSHRKTHSVFPRLFFSHQARIESCHLETLYARFFPDPIAADDGPITSSKARGLLGTEADADTDADADALAEDSEGNLYYNEDAEERTCISRTMVKIPLLKDQLLAIPRLSNGKKQRERILNDIGLRMVWIAKGKFDERPVFLQKSSKIKPPSPIPYPLSIYLTIFHGGPVNNILTVAFVCSRLQ